MNRPTSFVFARRMAAIGLSLLGLSALAPAGAQAADLHVEISNIASTQGRVMVALFDTADAMKTNAMTMGLQVQAERRSLQGTLRAVFADLPPGRYAVACFHDLNDDGKLSTNLLGLPNEPYGFSNKAQANFGPPSFEAAAVTVGASTVTTAITLQ